MKKIWKLIILLLIVGTIIPVMVACEPTDDPIDKVYVVKFESNGGSTVKQQEIISGKFATEPKDPTRDDYEFGGWYEDNKLTKLFDFATPITSNITLYAGWSEIEKNLTLVQSVALNANLVSYENNKSEKENKRTEFFDLSHDYIVGDDNAWNFKPAVSFLSYNTKTKQVTPVVVAAWNYFLSLEIYDETSETFIKILNNNVLNEEYNYIDKISSEDASVDFSSNAIGKTFRISVFPDGLTDTQKEDLEDYTVSYVINVVDGYNVYNAKELSLMENRTAAQYSDENNAWTTFKEANNIDVNLHPNTLILHKNINITTDDIPERFIYTEDDLSKSDSDYDRTLGSLKDYYYLYAHETLSGETFTLSGNYFTLSSAALPVVTRESGNITAEGEVISHATLFEFFGLADGTAITENLNLIGNAPRVENNIKGGGLIFIKVTGTTYYAKNNIAVCWFITYMPEVTLSPFRIEKCKCYDNFNSFLYNWGSPDLVISDSEMIGAGGPVIIQDHVTPTAADGGKAPSTKFINSNVSSYVVGSEGWFTIVKASAVVPQIKALDAYFTPFGTSFLKTNQDKSLTYLNLICVNKSGSAQSITAEKVSGSFSINGATFDYGAKTNPYLAGLLDNTYSLGAPGFESSNAEGANGIAFGTNTGLFDVNNTQITDPTNKLFSGTEIAMYYNGMMFVLGYGEANQIYTA